MATNEESLGRYEGEFGEINRGYDNAQTGTISNGAGTKAVYNDKYVQVDDIKSDGTYKSYVMEKDTYDKFAKQDSSIDTFYDRRGESENIGVYNNMGSALNAINNETVGYNTSDKEDRNKTALNYEEVISLCNTINSKTAELKSNIDQLTNASDSLSNTMYSQRTKEYIERTNNDIVRANKHIELMDEIVALFKEYARDIRESSSSLKGGSY